MRSTPLARLATLFWLIGCGSSPAPGGSPNPGTGTGGTGGAGGSGGTVVVGGAGGTGGGTNADAAAPGGSGGGGTGGAPVPPPPDAAPAGDAPAGGKGMLAFYEAEAIAPNGPNQLIAPAVVSNCPDMAPNCGAPEAIKADTPCCSQGKEVRQLLRGRGGLVFNKIAAPADGMYDVTWYYHCGKNDNFGDGNCGGEPNHPPAGCRPQVLTVNGERLPKVFEFHCFPGPWGLIHAVTTPIPLKAGGDNSVRVVATPGRDAVDLDAIAVFPAGQGAQPAAFSH